MKKFLMPPNYKSLVSKVTKEFAELEDILKRRTAEGMWRVGKYIDEHLLHHKDRADYGKTVIEQLAKDVNRDRSTLQRSLEFYRAYPIRAPGHKLDWSHYRILITVKDRDQRKKLEQQIIRKKWDTHQLQEYLNTKRELTAPGDKPLDSARGKPVPQLSFTRGRLHTYTIVPANKAMSEKGMSAIDLGFREQEAIPVGAPRLKESDAVELLFREGGLSGLRKVEAPKDGLFTYQACVEKVIDGDTLLVSFDFNLDRPVSQKLRLRGIDCPEIDTEEGKKAKRFVESRLKDVEFIIVKTYKDRTDKFDRYLADVFYLADCSDCVRVAREGVYLNQELLDNRLAIIWK